MSYARKIDALASEIYRNAQDGNPAWDRVVALLEEAQQLASKLERSR